MESQGSLQVYYPLFPFILGKIKGLSELDWFITGFLGVKVKFHENRLSVLRG